MKVFVVKMVGVLQVCDVNLLQKLGIVEERPFDFDLEQMKKAIESRLP